MNKLIIVVFMIAATSTISITYNYSQFNRVEAQLINIKTQLNTIQMLHSVEYAEKTNPIPPQKIVSVNIKKLKDLEKALWHLQESN